MQCPCLNTYFFSKGDVDTELSCLNWRHEEHFCPSPESEACSLDSDVTSVLVLSAIPLAATAAGKVFPFSLLPWTRSVDEQGLLRNVKPALQGQHSGEMKILRSR